MTSKKKKTALQSLKLRKLLDIQPNQSRAPGEIQGFSKRLKPNRGQGRGQRVKAR